MRLSTILLVLFLVLQTAAIAAPGSISGFKFHDLNGNGVLDPGETGMSGSVVTLLPFGNTAVTDVNGNYQFNNIFPGTYLLAETTTDWWVTFPAEGKYTVVLGDGENVTGKDFGVFHLADAKGALFQDLNHNGIKDPGEPGLKSWAARLTATGGVALKIANSGGSSDQYSIDLNVVNGPYSQKLTFGINPLATHDILVYGSDEQPDWTLGETPLPPPPPPSVFDARFVSIPGHPTYDLGFYVDIRPTVAPAQIDTFLVSTGTTDESFSITYSWPAGLGQFLQSCRLVDAFGQHPEVDVDMLADTTFTLVTATYGPHYAYIIAQRNPAFAGSYALTQADGAYGFAHIAPGTYTLTELTKNGWANSGPAGYSITVDGSGQSYADRDFPIVLGVASQPTKFLTFVPESLEAITAAKIPAAIKRKAVESYWEFTFKNTGVAPVTELHIQFKADVDKLHPIQNTVFSTVAGDTKKKFDFTGGSIAPGDSVVVKGYCAKAKPQQVKKFALGPWPAQSPALNLNPGFQKFLLPNPNFTNVIEETYKDGAFTSTGGLLVGTVLANKNAGGWVLMKNPGDVLKSLRDKMLFHTQGPFYFDFTKQQTSDSPKKHNNKLFAETVAFKLGIAASALGITMPGLGELTYVDPGNALDGSSLSDIAGIADQYLTGKAGDIDNLYSVMRRIDSALTGPIDTLNFADSLLLEGTANVASISFLHENKNAPVTRITPHRQVLAEIPAAFALDQNYPNPFNPTTTIRFTLPSDAFVSLKVYNILGQEVTVLLDHEQLGAGSQSVQFNASRLSSGVYFYRITADGITDDDGVAGRSFTSVMKMVLMK